MPNELYGVRELSKQLGELGGRLGKKALRSATFKSTTPVVREMKSKAPKGTEAHRTYKGRLVAPGFLSRSVKRRTKIRGGKVQVSIGVRREAFYGVAFLDEGITVSSRRRGGGRKAPVDPYTIRGHRWFKPVFRRNKDKMISGFRDLLSDAIRKAKAKG